MKHILFVCSGNTCRSPMAESLFLQQLKKAGDADIVCEVQSAGVFAGAGLPASSEAIQVTRELGLNLSTHRSQVLRQDHLDWADLVLTMTDSHRQYILSRFEVPVRKVYTLTEFAGVGRADVLDPYGAGIDMYRQCLDQLQTLIELIIKQIL
ncbi:Protein-tyrosine phosphatase/arsenate reductase [Syntrophomonas zehnderi OL-4]|uniref:Protein-tyrosine phosphatase/arsenate reductase n=1 Tax=Syntrophomonas zehnderi OL-4 TaxID=690567 RepID=A0A0E3W2I8_9FIRM|nr:low molecular weight protein arginine phosphatase [Syntrophomonas zehnderi]CFX02729.1 Protein-tyrosine phosphatase/arsenate reductase [Syntrophomonas zehnderi OL-4]